MYLSYSENRPLFFSTEYYSSAGSEHGMTHQFIHLNWRAQFRWYPRLYSRKRKLAVCAIFRDKLFSARGVLWFWNASRSMCDRWLCLPDIQPPLPVPDLESNIIMSLMERRTAIKPPIDGELGCRGQNMIISIWPWWYCPLSFTIDQESYQSGNFCAEQKTINMFDLLPKRNWSSWRADLTNSNHPV